VTRYKNINGDSGVIAYEIGDDFILAQFHDRKTYSYSYAKAGAFHVEIMKKLARQGHGLNSYINRNVRKLYD